MGKLSLLQELYREEKQPVLLFGMDFRILWMNAAAKERFPVILEEMDIREQFPAFSFEGLQDMSASGGVVVRNAQDGGGRLSIQRFQDQAFLFSAVWSETAVYHLGQGDTRSAGGIQLMDAWLRQGVFRIFNNLDQLSLTLEKSGNTAGLENIERIERNCQQLLRLGFNLNGYYGGEGNAPVWQDTFMADFLDELFREVDFRLNALNLTLSRSIQCGGVACRIDRRQFSSALINLIDLSAAYAPEGGRMEIAATHSGGEFCLTFTDSHTPAGELKGGLSCTAMLTPQGRSSLCLPKVSLGYLDRVVRESGGRLLLEGRSAGIKAVIRLPLSETPPVLQVRDEAAYTVRYRGQNRTSLVSILLSDLGE